jgi:signal transduction histidine kinase/CheY-like chemotaxis protein
VLTQALEKQGFVKDCESVLKRKDGQKLFVIESATAVRNEHGKIVVYQGIIHDLTEHKQLEKQLFHSQKMEAVGQLTGGIAHDFNNLLTVVLGNVEFGLQDCKPNDPVYQDLIRIENAASQACNLISQLLSFSRQQILRPKLLNLNKTVQDLSKMLGRVIGENIELKTKLARNLPPIWADPVQIQQVLMNLCVNARDAMPEGGKLFLKTRHVAADNLKGPPLPLNKSSNFVQLTITDTGIGMDKETQARIFEPFFTTKELGKGTGLGLSVVYGIVKQHQGHVEVVSKKDNGTTFKIYFPVKAQLESAVFGKKKLLSSLGGNETILIVEDEEAVLNVTARILKRLGYSVLTARDGTEAIEIFETRHKNIDLAILDVLLPKSSGPEIYKKMLSIKSNLAGLFVTGYDFKANLDKLDDSEERHTRILQKPYTKETLGKTVRELLEP